jgi:hypothetical protein
MAVTPGGDPICVLCDGEWCMRQAMNLAGQEYQQTSGEDVRQ